MPFDAFVYAAICAAIYIIARDLPEVLRRERPASHAVWVGATGTLRLSWRSIAVCALVGLIVSLFTHGYL